MKIMIINGPNLNMLGIREKEIYGNQSYKDLCKTIKDYAKSKKIKTDIYFTNYEGDIVSLIQMAYYKKYDGIVINPAAYTHTSIAIHDALKSVMIPAVEVHISNINEREEYRKKSFVSDCVIDTIMGHGFNGYIEAIDKLLNK